MCIWIRENCINHCYKLKLSEVVHTQCVECDGFFTIVVYTKIHLNWRAMRKMFKLHVKYRIMVDKPHDTFVRCDAHFFIIFIYSLLSISVGHSELVSFLLSPSSSMCRRRSRARENLDLHLVPMNERNVCTRSTTSNSTS